jgi:hypothetical protein
MLCIYLSVTLLLICSSKIHFNFVGGSAPQGPPAYGIQIHVRAYGKNVLKIEVRTRRRLCEPSCRRLGLTGVYPCEKSVRTYTQYTYLSSFLSSSLSSSLVAAEWHLVLVVACYYEIEIFIFFTIPTTLVAIPVSFAVGSVFHAVSESADTLSDCSVTECQLRFRVAALCYWQVHAHQNASLVRRKSFRCKWEIGVKQKRACLCGLGYRP